MPEPTRPTIEPPPAVDAPRPMTPQAQRALAEANARRQAREAAMPEPLPTETGGRAGPDPVRYGDWEQGGIARDF